MTDTDARATSEAEWWRVWREEDFSWEGLREKRLPRHFVDAGGELVFEPSAATRPATLQDYWRTEEGHLIEGDGKRWTRAHCPLHWSDGTPAKADWKAAQWRELNNILAAKVRDAAVARQQTNNQFPLAHLGGAVFALAPILPDDRSLPLFLQCLAAYIDEPTARMRTFGEVHFINTFFAGDANFEGATFQADSIFQNAIIVGDCDFADAEFSKRTAFHNVEFGGRCTFQRSKFRSLSFFQNSDFREYARFQDAEFHSRSRLDHATFHSGADFLHAVFHQDVHFTQSKFLGPLSMRGVAFHRSALFWSTRFARDPRHFSGSFARARFEHTADFSGSGSHWISALDGSVIAGKLLLDHTTEAAETRAFKEEVLPALDQSAAMIQNESDEPNDPSVSQAAREVLLRELEGGCRVLQLVSSEEQDAIREQQYHRFKLTARQLQLTVSRIERMTLLLYAALSDYGTSILRPLVGLGLTTLSAATIFWMIERALAGYRLAPLSAWASGQMALDPTFFEALRYSASRVFPIGAFQSPLPEPGSWLARLLTDHGPGWGLLIRTIATAESVLALALVFLLALALRRRFQIG